MWQMEPFFSSSVLRTACWRLGRARRARVNTARQGQGVVSVKQIVRCGMGC